jgi:O-antigen ligase
VTGTSRLSTLAFLAALFCATFEKLHWRVPATLRLADLLSLLFVAVFVAERLYASDHRLPRTAAVLAAFLAAFVLVDLAGFYNLETTQGVNQFGKGIVTFLIHFTFLVCAVAFLVRRSERFFWRSLGWFLAGMAFNAAYGFLQLAFAVSGHNLDAAVLSPLTGGASSINIYGAVKGASVYRPNALTGDPNHLGIVLIVPLLVLAPIYLRLEPRHRLRVPLALLLAGLFVMELATLSRSGLLGLAVGAAVLAVPYRGLLLSKQLLVPLGGLALVLAAVILRRLDFFTAVFRARLNTGSAATSVHLHLDVYDFIPQVLHSHPLFGLGFNNFSVYYEFVTGKTDWGPHSFYVALLVETGLIGTALFATFLWYLFRRLKAARAIGRVLAAKQDPAAARVRPLAWGLTAALVGTMAANVFYLTMTFDYFYAFAVFVLAAPLVFARRAGMRPA